MIFTETAITDALIVDIEQLEDERGFFARSFCQNEFKKAGVEFASAQCNISYNKSRGTLRGVHSQAKGYEEAKLVRCTKGSIYDLIVDLREDSASYLKHYGIELSDKNHRMIYVPKGVYHGFLTLEDETEVSYQMSEFYSPNHALGVRWNDPILGLEWPNGVIVISERDAAFPDYLPNSR